MKELRADPSINFLKDKLGTRYARIRPFEKSLFNAYSPSGFLNWYHCYLEKTSGMRIHAIRIDMLKVRFNQQEHLVIDSSEERNVICRVVFLFIFCSLIYSCFSGTLLHQLCQPALKFLYADPSYWAMHLTAIPKWLTQNPSMALGFDLALMMTCLFCIIFPDRRWLMIIFFILYFCYFICFNSYGTLHTHSKVGVLLMPVPFIAFRKQSFTFLWEGLRYFTLFVYVSAFLWKLSRATFMHWQQASLIIKLNLAPYMYFNPHSFQTAAYSWLLQHDSISGWIFNLGILLEGSFVVGFFTRKFDKHLLLFSVLLPVGFAFFADAFFFELCILSLTLIDFRRDRGNPYRLNARLVKAF
jgi:hypothetical protein